LLNHPWNPVGTVFTPAELESMADFVREHDLVLISDEIYESLTYDGQKHVSPAGLAGARERTVLVNSLSKTYAMTGWRVGYSAARADLIRAMLLLLQQFSRGPATFVQDAAAAALEGSQTCVQQMTGEYQARRDLTIERLTGIRGAGVLKPEGGLFVMVDLRALLGPPPRRFATSDAVRKFLLEEHGVVVVQGSAYGDGGEGMLRVSFAAGGQTLERGLELLRNGLCNLSSEAERR
jgi:aminotransferase